ncbi:MAG: beta-lactamase family protein [candidate division Zixibacteria bacterium]|nr:beta-lactamase family protein [candidate division Zixibacteria bacterium]
MKSLTEMDRLLEELACKDEFSGVVRLTRGKEELFSTAYGYACRQWQIKNRTDTRFDTASVTKLFTTAAILLLIDRKRLSFDTRVIEFLDLKNTALSNEISVFHLLTHTSGIGDDSEEEDGEIYEDLWREKPNYSVTATADFLPQFVRKKPNFEPGTSCRYCNCGYILLGLAIEKISGQTYREFVREQIFERLGMDRTAFLRLDGVDENVAEGYAPVRDKDGNITGWRKNIYAYPPVGSPDSGAYTTAGDMIKFIRALLEGKLLSPELTADLLTPKTFYQSGDDYEWRYGYGFEFLLDKKTGKIISLRKSGVNTGVCAWAEYFVEPDITLAAFGNYDDCLWKPLKDIQKMIIGGYLEK